MGWEVGTASYKDFTDSISSMHCRHILFSFKNCAHIIKSLPEQVTGQIYMASANGHEMY